MSAPLSPKNVYAGLLRLHPPAFRSRFAAEMMLNFEESRPAVGSCPLLVDAVRSLVRQWLLRSGSWKLVLAAAGAALQLLSIAALWFRAP